MKHDLKLLMRRGAPGDDSMLGEISVEGKFICYSLEDEPREKKIAAETAIPARSYRILPRAEGKMHPDYAKRYGAMHVGMAHLQDVPGFKYIYIHTGNTDDHTEGCILVGEGFKQSADGNFTVWNSRVAYKRLYAMIAKAWAAGGEVWITIEDPA